MMKVIRSTSLLIIAFCLSAVHTYSQDEVKRKVLMGGHVSPILLWGEIAAMNNGLTISVNHYFIGYNALILYPPIGSFVLPSLGSQPGGRIPVLKEAREKREKRFFVHLKKQPFSN